VTARYAIRCGTCRTSDPLTGPDLSSLSTQVVAFMAVHEHVNRDFAVVPVPAQAPAVIESGVTLTARIPSPAKPDRVGAA
jgi:hypothetical protein